MVIKNIEKEWFNREGHLAFAGLSVVVDVLVEAKNGSIPLPLQNHISVCHKCRKEIMAVYDIYMLCSTADKNSNDEFLSLSEPVGKYRKGVLRSGVETAALVATSWLLNTNMQEESPL